MVGRFATSDRPDPAIFTMKLLRHNSIGVSHKCDKKKLIESSFDYECRYFHMAYLGADQLIFDEKWQGLERLVTTSADCPAKTRCVADGVRFAVETQLGLGRVGAFFRAADQLMPQQRFAHLFPVKLADYIKLQLEDRPSTAREKAQRRRNLFTVMTELQNRDALTRQVQQELAPGILFAFAARSLVDKVNNRLLRAEAQGAPVLVVRERQPKGQGYGYRVMVDYPSSPAAETVAGGTKAIIIDALRRHDGSAGRTIHDAAAVIVRMRQGFWDIARQVVRMPEEREQALQQFDTTQTLLRSAQTLAGVFPELNMKFVSASVLARQQKRLAHNQAKAAQQPDDKALMQRNAKALRYIARSKEALILIHRLHALRSALVENPQAHSMHNSRLQLNARQAAKSGKRKSGALQPG